MKYAIISDIHGNIYALRAVLRDAQQRRVDMYLFLGDYFRNCPWHNEVTQTIRGLDCYAAVRGNNEDYLDRIKNNSFYDREYRQFNLLYWNYDTFTKDNLDYLIKLPKKLCLYCDGEPIFLSHSSDIVYRMPRIPFFHSSQVKGAMNDRRFTHEQYLLKTRAALLSREDAVEDMCALPKGVHLFGHNHLQFYIEYKGRLFINPGSCGEAIDCDTAAAYTILERAGNQWVVDERRVLYDVGSAVNEMKKSHFADSVGPAWVGVIERQLLNGDDYFSHFVRHTIATAHMNGHYNELIPNDIWDAAIKTWDIEKISEQINDKSN